MIDRAVQAGVTHIVACGTDDSDWPATLELARRRLNIIPLLGLHPWFIEKARPDWLTALQSHLRNPAIGIGECGLDFAIETFDRPLQESVFRAQLALSRECNRPISIHCRKAWERLEILVGEIGVPEAGAVVHSYSGSPDMALRLQRLGLHISFSCSLANPNNKRVGKAVAAVSLDHLLFETDSPDIPPRHVEGWIEGTLNEPANIRLVSEAAARLRHQDEGLLVEHAFKNATRIFGTLFPRL